ncbi:MAG: ABC-F family ATP-binding cassette domain-containing protein [Candidatus Taylorbacteria bacterium]|nr:ABC-F family ATP-binding cassette domain-containing protein [Candidatus Taylorbacteria bacterium]
MSDEVILRFNKVSFEYGHNKPILNEVDFSVRKGTKITLMGQNGAGKSTIFELISGRLKPVSGTVAIDSNLTIGSARQVIPRGELELTVREFFASFAKASEGHSKVYDIDPKIDAVMEIVNLPLRPIRQDLRVVSQSNPQAQGSKNRTIRSFSGGQQARLLLASALIQDPDLLLLDEPTNNLDKAGIEHLTQFLINYKKTVIVISHDADFLNAFTDGVLYLDVYTRVIEQYSGNYLDVVVQIKARVEKENSKNARLAKIAIEKKEKANFFAMKGGRLRLLAKRMREDAAQMEEEQVDVRREDKAIRPFRIPAQPELIGEILHISSFTIIKNEVKVGKTKSKKQAGHKSVIRQANISLNKNRHLLLKGPNGIGKSTLLESIAKGTAEGHLDKLGTSAKIALGVRVGYYRQDFSTLNFDDTVYGSLISVMKEKDEQQMRSLAAGFLITGDMMKTKIGSLSEGQKGLVALARLVLQKPGLLILDEPTNHMNFRHIPEIAKALNAFEGAMVLVSHVPEFVDKIRIDEILDLGK